MLWLEDESLAFVANGRAYRSEFHINPSAETMLQLRGEMRLHYLTPDGEENYPFWRTLHPDAIPISARTGRGLDRLQEAVYQHVRGSQVDVTLRADVTNGKLLSFLESNTRIHDRQFTDGRIQMRAVMGRRTLADLSRNDQVEVKAVDSIS